jgi:hypothetical protein
MNGVEIQPGGEWRMRYLSFFLSFFLLYYDAIVVLDRMKANTIAGGTCRVRYPWRE